MEGGLIRDRAGNPVYGTTWAGRRLHPMRTRTHSLCGLRVWATAGKGEARLRAGQGYTSCRRAACTTADRPKEER